MINNPRGLFLWGFSMLSLELFKEKVKRLAKPNRFKIEVMPPPIIRYTDMDLADLTFFAKIASIPERTVGEHELKKYGMTYKVAGDMQFNDLNMTYLNDAEWNCRTFFEYWIDTIAHARNNRRAEPSEYLFNSRLRVHQLGLKENEILASYEFHDIYPKTVGEIELSMDATDQFEEFQVTFGYSYWVRVDAKWQAYAREETP